MNLDSDLQRILNVGAKVYHALSSRQGKVHSNNGIDIIVDYGKGTYTSYKIEEFSELLLSDTIVANSRVTQGNGESFKIKPREVQSDPLMADKLGRPLTLASIPATTKSQIDSMYNETRLNTKSTINRQEIGYINFSTGRFSTEPKKGYTKVEYRQATEKVTLELTSEQVDKLREMGLMK
jgi:hypothetical protein